MFIGIVALVKSFVAEVCLVGEAVDATSFADDDGCAKFLFVLSSGKNVAAATAGAVLTLTGTKGSRLIIQPSA